SPETLEYILTWEPEDPDGPPLPADQVRVNSVARWRIPFGAPAEFKRVPGQAAFALLVGPTAPPRFFWVEAAEVAKAEQAAEAFKTMVASKPHHDDSEAARVARALFLSSVAYQPPIDPSDPYNRPPPPPSSLDPWLPHPESVDVSAILQPKLLQPLLSDPGVLERLLPLLPPELEAETAADLLQVLSSPQYQTALLAFNTGLKFGELGQLTAEWGLDVLAGRGPANLLATVQLAVDLEAADGGSGSPSPGPTPES
ncbi:adhesion regulating molecule 1, partial [Massospora cicadina]